MKWVTGDLLHMDRTACPWLIRRSIDLKAEFIFLPPDTDPAGKGDHTFDMPGAEYGHIGSRCTFEVLLERFNLAGDAALMEMGRIVRDADVAPTRTTRREAPGLDALMTGFQLSTPDNHEKLRLSKPLYDALYAYCQAKVADESTSTGTWRPRLSYRRSAATHL